MRVCFTFFIVAGLAATGLQAAQMGRALVAISATYHFYQSIKTSYETTYQAVHCKATIAQKYRTGLLVYI